MECSESTLHQVLWLRDTLVSSAVDHRDLAKRVCHLCNAPSERIDEIYGLALIQSQRYKPARRTLRVRQPLRIAAVLNAIQLVC